MKVKLVQDSWRQMEAALMNRIHFVCLFLCLTFVARPAHSQTETVLYNFGGSPDGANPASSLTTDGKGNFYGTTLGGGEFGGGTVYQLSPNGNGGWNETVLYNFCSVAPFCSDGQSPDGPVTLDNLGNLYGTTEGGGTSQYGYGLVFELSPMGAGWKETVLHDFGDVGYYPKGRLIFDRVGNLYGMAGVVFELSPNGSGGWMVQTIYNGANEGDYYEGMTMDSSGNIFGVTNNPFTGVPESAVFELSPNGDGGWNQKVIYSHAAGRNGFFWMTAPVLGPDGNLYGTTMSGTAYKGHEAVYKITLETKGKKMGNWTEKVIYSFPLFNLAQKRVYPLSPGVLLDKSGNIYGSTVLGVQSVYELTPASKSSYTESTVWTFNGTDGSDPLGTLTLDSAGNLYGTTQYGGSFGGGVVFEVAP